MSLTWVNGVERAACIPCGDDREADRLFDSVTAVGTPMRGTRCRTCGSVTVHGGEQQWEPDDTFVDHYVQSEAGIDTILQNLYRVDLPPGAAFLDVGANYGFATLYARDVRGWHAVGVEPSYAGARGSRELGVEILQQYVTESTSLGRRFDLILASEVIEHVPDPRAFVAALRAHLAPHGVLLMTTPAAEVVRPETEHWAIQAVGPGGHLYLASEGALRSLMHEAGFGSVTVERQGMTLLVAATLDGARELSVQAHGPNAQQVADFLAQIESAPTSPPLLRAAMAVRRFRTMINMGHDAAAEEAAMIDAVRAAHDVDLDDPAGVVRRLAAGEALPVVIAPAAFACGMRRIVHRTEWPKAVDYFALAEASVDDKRRRFHIFDGDSRIIEAASRAHRALAMLHTDPAGAKALWARLRDAGQLVDPSDWTVRLYVEASAIGHGALFDDALDEVATAIVELGADGDQHRTIAAFNASVLLAQSAVRAGDRWCATQWVSVAEQLLAERAAVLEEAWASGAAELAAGIRHEVTPLRAEAIPSVVPMPGPEHEAILWQSAPHDEVAGAISVVMALYKGRQYVAEALASIAAQTRAPLEVIVVDDGSPDDSVAHIESLPLAVPVRIIRQGNAGQSAARNTGIRAARGEFVAFLDQDDVWRPQHLETLAAAFTEHPDRAWVFGDFDLIDGDGQTLTSSYLAETAVALDRRTVSRLVETDLMALPSASLMRRRALLAVRGFDRRLSGYEDDELYLRLFTAGYLIAPEPRARIRYRTHPANASSSVAFLRSRLIYLRMLTERFPNRPGHPAPVDAALPRLLRSTTHEYFQALVRRDDAVARTIAWAVSRMLPLAQGMPLSTRLGMVVMRRPRVMRAGLAVASALPPFVRHRLLPPMAEAARRQLWPPRSHAAPLDLGNRPAWLDRSGR